MVAIFDVEFRKRTLDDWGERLDAEHIAWGLVTEPEEVISGEQVNANEYVIGVEHPVLGHLRETAIPFQIRWGAANSQGVEPGVRGVY